jgi:hypothetical protein
MFGRTFRSSQKARRSVRADLNAADRARKWGMKESEEKWLARAAEARDAERRLAAQEQRRQAERVEREARERFLAEQDARFQAAVDRREGARRGESERRRVSWW